MKYRILTDEEHKKHVHLCGRTGEEIDIIHPCKDCPSWFECMKSHAIKGIDAEKRFPRIGG